MSVERQFSRGVAWMAVGNWIEQGVNFAVFVTLARLLGARDYGLLSMASVFVVLSESLVRESLSEYLIAHEDPGPGDLDATFWLLAGLGAILALGLAGLAPLFARAYGQAEVAPLILALAPSVLIVALNAVPVALLRRRLEFRILSLRAIAGVVLGGAVGIGMALKGYGVWSFVGQWLVLIATNAVMAWTAVDWRPGRACSRGEVGRAAHFGAQVLGLRAGELAATQVPLLLIGATLGPVATGLFSVAWRLVETLSFLIVTPLRQASQSAFAALGRQGNGAAGVLLADITRLTGLVAVPFFAGLALLAAPMILLILGAEWRAAAPVLQVMALMGIYICLNRLQMAFCLAAGRAGAISALTWVVVGLAAVLIWAVSAQGIVAVAAALVAAHYLLWPAYFAIVARIAGRPALGFVTCHILPCLGALVMALPVWWCVRAMGDARPLFILALAVPVGIAIYLTFSLALMRDRFALLFALVRGRT